MPTSPFSASVYCDTESAPPILQRDQIWLEWSDDRGHHFGNPVLQPLNGVGAYRTSLQWQRLGYARDRVFRITWSCSTLTALKGAWVEAEAGAKT